MVRFSEAAAEKTRRAMQYQREHEEKLQPRTITVLLEKRDDLLSAASTTKGDFVWISDEPRERGGEGKGPSPLLYFLSSMGFCQLVHYAEHSIVDGIQLESLRMKIDGTITLQRPRRFTEITYQAVISSGETDETIRNLARRAAEDCYVTNTLRRGCAVTGIIMHNGRKIDEHR